MQKAIMDRVFIKPDEKKQGLIIIQDNDETKTGVVVSVGDEVKSVKVGDRVIFFKWDDLPALDGLIAVRENSLLGIIEDE
jgi:co-chaperonin GroES (HSP10)